MFLSIVGKKNEKRALKHELVFDFQRKRCSNNLSDDIHFVHFTVRMLQSGRKFTNCCL